MCFLAVGEFLVGGDVFAAVLFLKDEELWMLFEDGHGGVGEETIVRGQFFEELVRVARTGLRSCLGSWRCRFSAGSLRWFSFLIHGVDAAFGQTRLTFVGEVGALRAEGVRARDWNMR